MSRPLSLKLRARPVPTPLVLSPLPISPDYSVVWAQKSSENLTATPMTTGTDKTLTPFMLSACSNQSSASVYSCDSYSSVEDWSEISQLSSQTTGIPNEYMIRSFGDDSSDYFPNWTELARVLNRPQKGEDPTPIVSVTREHIRKLRSRSIAALQLEGRRLSPRDSLPIQQRKSRVKSDSVTSGKPPRSHLRVPLFTPSIFVTSSDDTHSPSNPPPFTPSALLVSPSNDTPPIRVSRWERPKRSVSTRDRGGGGGLALPSLPDYIPIEGLDTKQDEKLKVRGSRTGLVFTVAQIPALASPCGGSGNVYWM